MLLLLKYRLISIMRDKMTMSWTFLFPLVLCTLFYVSIWNMEDSIDCVSVAVVEKSHTQQSELFCQYLEKVEESNPDLLRCRRQEEREAKKQLEKEKIAGIFYVDARPELVVRKTGVEESILQSVLETYNSKADFIEKIEKEKPEKLPEAMEKITQESQKNYVLETDLGGKKTNGMIHYFFSLIAMTCLFGSILGMDGAAFLQANIESVGARRCVSPTNKLKLVLADLILITGINFVDVTVLLVYMKVILKIPIGNQWGKMLLVSLVGGMIGVSIGILLGSVGRWSENIRSAFVMTFSLGSSFLSGLMVSGIKGVIEEHCPIVNRLNPASLISDAFYSIAVYSDSKRYLQDVFTMSVIAVICIVASVISMRRVRYDSI